MPIEAKCQACGVRFRAPDKYAGKRVKCPKCAAAIQIPADGQEQATDQPAAEQKPEAETVQAQKPPAEKAEWHMQTEDGQEFGPVSKTELDSWVRDGRIDGSCQVLKEGWDQWKWAEDVYPELAESDEEEESEEDEATMFAGIVAGGQEDEEEEEQEEEINPFASPQATAEQAPPEAQPADAEAITPAIRQALAQTKPWVTFLSFLGFFFGGLGALAGLLMLAIAVFALSIGGMISGLMVLVGPALYLAAAYYLFTYGRKIGAFLKSDAVVDFEQAMGAQKSFWKLAGMVTASVLGIYLVLGLLLVVIGLATAAT